MQKGFTPVYIVIPIALLLGVYLLVSSQIDREVTAPEVMHEEEEVEGTEAVKGAEMLPQKKDIVESLPDPRLESAGEGIFSEEDTSSKTVIVEPEPEFKPDPEPQDLPPPLVEEVKTTLVWTGTINGWVAEAPPPACPEPLVLTTPTDLSLVTSVLYPGQKRGGQYKPHGGFRYDNSQADDITIMSPMAAVVVDGGRFFVDGEIQYTFDLISPCGIWYRFGHLRKLSPKFVALAETLPEPVEGDSRTYGFDNTVTVVPGEVIATAVGFIEDSNIFVDWGVYDLRSKNEASKDPYWAQDHPGQQAQNGVCWFGLLSTEDEAIVKSLPPADGVSGATSDYCL